MFNQSLNTIQRRKTTYRQSCVNFHSVLGLQSYYPYYQIENASSRLPNSMRRLTFIDQNYTKFQHRQLYSGACHSHLSIQTALMLVKIRPCILDRHYITARNSTSLHSHQQSIKSSSCGSDQPSTGQGYYRKTSELRSSFLTYFEQQGHLIVPSSNIVTKNDPTLLFTSAGMVPFKDFFLGMRTPPQLALASAQKCLRAGGKHNDLENVGYTSRHHTFFEMLGNFSFGAYNESVAISLSWKYLTHELGLPPERLSVTVLEGDEETAGIWKKTVGLPSHKIRFCSMNDNFWSMGDSEGPCGPCTEIFWDQLEPIDGEQYLEIWNLVFMRYLRTGSNHSESHTSNDLSKTGNYDNFMLKRLPRTCIDTGMGLERLASVIQDKDDNFASDAFSGILQAIRSVIEVHTGRLYSPSRESEIALRVLADHLRAACFLIAEGLLPGSQGQAYVLRRIIRRATHHTYKLGIKGPVLASLLPSLLETFQSHYHELGERQEYIKNVLTHEEVAFFLTIDRGLKEIHLQLRGNQDLVTPGINPDSSNQSPKIISGEQIFRMYETFGFPADLTDLIAREHGCKIDLEAFECILSEKRGESRAIWKSIQKPFNSTFSTTIKGWQIRPRFTGYQTLHEENAKIIGIHKGDGENEYWLAIDPCPFYAESGGQIGDHGYLLLRDKDNKKNQVRLNVINCVEFDRHCNALHVQLNWIQERDEHHLSIPHTNQADIAQRIQIGTIVEAFVDQSARAQTSKNHTATHLLQYALRQVLGSHVFQTGSLVTPHALRFDFCHYEPLGMAHLAKIEQLVNQAILDGLTVCTDLMTYEDAKRTNAMALFEEKYDQDALLRVVRIQDLSVELCGGTHIHDTSQIGYFKIVAESSAGLGIRRVHALTSVGAFKWLESKAAKLDIITQLVKSDLSTGYRHSDKNHDQPFKEQAFDGAVSKVEQLLIENKRYNKEAVRLKEKLLDLYVMLSKFENNHQVLLHRHTHNEVEIKSNVDRVLDQVNAISSSPNHIDSGRDYYGNYKGFYNGIKVIVHYYNINLLPLDPKLTRNASDQVRRDDPERILVCCINSSYASTMKEIFLRLQAKGGGSATLIEGQIIGEENQILSRLKQLVGIVP